GDRTAVGDGAVYRDLVQAVLEHDARTAAADGARIVNRATGRQSDAGADADDFAFGAIGHQRDESREFLRLGRKHRNAIGLSVLPSIDRPAIDDRPAALQPDAVVVEADDRAAVRDRRIDRPAFENAGADLEC